MFLFYSSKFRVFFIQQNVCSFRGPFSKLLSISSTFRLVSQILKNITKSPTSNLTNLLVYWAIGFPRHATEIIDIQKTIFCLRIRLLHKLGDIMKSPNTKPKRKTTRTHTGVTQRRIRTQILIYNTHVAIDFTFFFLLTTLLILHIGLVAKLFCSDLFFVYKRTLIKSGCGFLW